MKLQAEWLESPAAQAVTGMLEAGGHQALFVGGCVRNALMGLAPGDLDLATDARPRRVTELAKAAGIKAVPTGIEHGTVTLVVEGEPLEVTTFRADVETDGRHAIVRFSTDVAEDAARRDFTMNALYARSDGELLDPLGGLPDLQARRVRFIGEAPQRIAEDALRILRFFRFTAWYGDPAEGIDTEGLAACAEAGEMLEHLSRERIGHEMMRLLAAADPAPALASMQASGLLARVLPGAEALAIAPLVHAEAALGLAPDAVRRLAALGGESPFERFRLSKAAAKRTEALRQAVASPQGPAELGYRLGAEDGASALALRGAGPEALEPLRRGAGAEFPVMAADLKPEFEGPALGQRLRELERLWVESGFTLGREALLDLKG
ncbi:CCA tRNA nucleotidyltransferase [Pseudoroseicyclus tamaricis]|uniref:CCA tRNA nucleotidyltransferase n=1 Tax=Pseudoroseicyclus tamaricis TaxID=2705421 RepID=A0A6B2JX57_9RHOB|nr:CCA tRNA nucleotidyltransferase [Pseudoroseicyclus tamaricis]NDV02710.1 CCA tRNA nucleotidyltransferase [Pseudoroseicyclus tamaricis]